MKIKVDFKILFFLVLFYFTHQITLYLGVMLFCFIHELGHLIIGMVLGLEPKQIVIMPLGFYIEFNQRKIKREILVALAGPIVSLLIAMIFVNIHIPNINNDIIVYANLMICAFNLLPIYPLDGGRILKNILEIFVGDIKSITYINAVSYICVVILTMIASILIFYLQNISIFFITLYLWFIVIKQDKYIKEKMKLWDCYKKYSQK